MKDYKKIGIFLSCLIVAIGGIIYELIIASTASYLIGNSILQFSLTIGIYLFGMGIGSYFVRFFEKKAILNFIIIELIISIIGGLSGFSLYFVFGYYNKLFFTYFIFLVFTIGIFIGFEIPLLVKILEKQNSKSKNLSNVLTLDYIGALFASIIFPLILLPYIGVIKSALIVGMMNLIISILLMFFFFKNNLKKIILFFQFSSLILMVTLLLNSIWISNILEHKFYQDQIIFSKQSHYQKIVLTQHNNDTRLYLDRNLQFSSVDEYRYRETIVHSLFKYLPNYERILVLGGGDGLAVREILKNQKVKEIVLVDIDSEITNLAKNYDLLKNLNNNSLNNSKVKIINQDAQVFLRENTELFQGIIIDFPDPNNETLAKLYTKEFYQLINKNLSKDGAFITQSSSVFFTKKTFWLINNTINNVFEHTVPIHTYVPSFGEWGFVIGSNYILKQNQEYNIDELELKYFDQNNFDQSHKFSKDLISDIDIVNTNENLQIINIYNQEIKSYR